MILPVKFIKTELPEPHSYGFDQWPACSVIYFTCDHFFSVVSKLTWQDCETFVTFLVIM